ncbi:hypothetical protein [Alteraurantiacibacter aquimixticola]|uniref:PilZ domain-containing protein n=1 Tax=Alteraurantiacibacter aquimixticola TaxID=2489173 RepID=A0A4T3F415_9SPHN|nr:hypothetical protein [Alteraurantiacibacter aquimixticola]TIX51044.1 hypothetical protein E5222_00725 [Alteraurantiacibacter aquimixticola]
MTRHTSSPVQELRDAVRQEAQMGAIIRKRGGQKMPGTLVNATIAGFCMDSPFRGNVGETYYILIPGLESQTVQLKWTSVHLHGFALEKPLHPVILAQLCESEMIEGPGLVSLSGGASEYPQLHRSGTSLRERLIRRAVG